MTVSDLESEDIENPLKANVLFLDFKVCGTLTHIFIPKETH
jgi:hypothetical protein